MADVSMPGARQSSRLRDMIVGVFAMIGAILKTLWTFALRSARDWWAVTGSNRRPSRCKRDALPTELTALGLTYCRSTAAGKAPRRADYAKALTPPPPCGPIKDAASRILSCS
jgi:hypothetical protein